MILGLQDLRPQQAAYNVNGNATRGLTVPGRNVGVINNNVGVTSRNVSVSPVMTGRVIGNRVPQNIGVTSVQGNPVFSNGGGMIGNPGGVVVGNGVTSPSSQQIELVGQFKLKLFFICSHYK